MCGIAGIIDPFAPVDQIRERLTPMLQSLKHRGPDAEGMFLDQGIGLVHARLSIIDLAGGVQPLTNEDETVHLVVNGEIYNYPYLREDLIKRGHTFRTQSDSEVIVHLYEDFKENCTDFLEGMFAFAIWDHPKKSLLLARDRFGIKPLYLAVSDDQVLFASELTAILKARRKPAGIDIHSLYKYLAFGYVPAPASIIRGIDKLRPAQRVHIQDGRIHRVTYWQPQPVAIPNSRNRALQELGELTNASVQTHLLSDVPVAAFLSGGVDSSTVAATAQKHQPMTTLCVSFPGTGVDEAPIAHRVADHLGTKHIELAIDLDPLALLQDVVAFMDEPFADSSALPTFTLCRAARGVAKVVLSGDGGDEVFGGYTGRYRVAAMKALLPHPAFIAEILQLLPPWRSGRRSSLPDMLSLAEMSDEERYIMERQITTASDRRALFDNPNIEAEDSLRSIATAELAVVAHRHPVHRALWMDMRTSLPDDMLTKVDRMSMAHGLEVRVPFLDRRLVEFAFSLPPSWLVSPLPVEGKRLLRKFAEPLLPAGILGRPKQGFVVPLNAWLRNAFLPLFDELCADGSTRIFHYLNRTVIQDIRNRPLAEQPREDLYALLFLELWLRKMGL
ncbi:MAG: asparagine synthase (glutamine-hydrolyzing) [Desulfobacterales bacterium]|nr:asparagine synthase (glutamine-hydrolyzing) [Desulfobacterales bacterium]